MMASGPCLLLAALLAADGEPVAASPEDAPEVVSRDVSFFPGGSLFHAPLASPKEPGAHVSWLHLVLPGGSYELGSVAFGDSFGLVRWPGWAASDSWQVGISGVVLAQFNLGSTSMDLINADYVIGVPVAYQNGAWSGRVRGVHQSSHLGDEFLLLPQAPELRQARVNLSFETVELLGGWEWKGLRASGGPSYIVHTNTELGRASVQVGLDFMRTRPVFEPTMNLFASVMCHAWEETGWNPDLSAKAGLNLRSPYVEKRSIQLFAEGYKGNLPFGQFYQLKAVYFGGGINFSF